MRAAWHPALPALPALLLLAACNFGSPPGAGDGDGDGGDGNGGPDGAPGCADDDGDTVCNTADQCAGHDDRSDVDGDSVPDGCDDWPCGLKPDDPGDPMADTSIGRAWGAENIDVGNSRRVVVAPGAQFSAELDWGLFVVCPSGQQMCRAQVEFGYGPARTGCFFDGDVPDQQITGQRNVQLQLTAPPTPGVYELRLNAGRRSSCGTNPWYNGDPGGDSTIAIVCVR